MNLQVAARWRIISVPDRPLASAKEVRSLLYYTLPQKSITALIKRGVLLFVLSYHSSDTPYWHQGKGGREQQING
jgi:hypothetical protein